MQSNKLLAYLLIGIGSLFLLSRINLGSDWLWIALISAAFLWAYSKQKRYGFLVTGSILAGLGVGILLNSWSGLLISLAVGFYAIERVEPRSNRWPVSVAAVLAAIGVLGWLVDSDFFGSFGFAIILLAGGAYLLMRDRRKEVSSSPAADTFTTISPQPTSTRPADIPPTDTQPTKDETLAPEETPPTVKQTPKTAVGEGSAEPAASDSNKTPPPQASQETAAPEAATPADKTLYQNLEQWRRETAQREDRAAYLILTNASLEQIAQDRPQTLEALRDIRGIGPVKLERYGEAILDLTRAA